MKQIWRKAWLSTAVFAATLFAVAGISVPLFFNHEDSNVSLRNLAVIAAGSHSFSLSDPIVLHDKPRITIKRGTIALPRSSTASGNDTPASRSPGAVGASALVLQNAVIEISISEGHGSRQNTSAVIAPLAEALAALKFTKLTLKNTTVIVDAGKSGSHRLRSVRGTLDLVPQASLQAIGEFSYRGETISFNTSLGLNTNPEDRVGMPLKAKFEGGLFNAQLNGKLTVSNRLQLIADSADVSLKSVGDVASWLGIPWRAGPRLEKFKAVGKLVWAGQTLRFQNAKFAIGSNKAGGTLSVSHRDKRPMIEGTLAFSSLDFTDYLSESNADDTFPFAKPIAWLRQFGLGPENGVLALIDEINADLRISTGRVIAGSSSSGPGSATLSLKGGKLLADLTETLPEFGSTGNVQVSLDVTRREPHYSIRGKLQRLDVAHLTKFAFGHPILSGPAEVTIDVHGQGATRQAFTRSLSGKAAVKITEDASLALDLRRLFEQKRRGTAEPGWGSALNGKTKLSGVDASMLIRNGTAQAKLLRAKLGDKTVSVAGTIKMPARSIDLKVSVGDETPGAAARTDGAAKVEILHVTGDWDAPNVTSTQRASSDESNDSRQDPGNNNDASRG